MRAVNRPLKLAPKAFDGIRVNVTVDVFFAPVVDLAVLVPEFRGVPINRKFVAVENGSPIHVAGNVSEDIGSRDRINDLGNNLAVPLNDANNRSLARRATATLAGASAADVGFIGLHNARQLRRLAVCHEFTDLMRHTPRRLIRDAKLALKLFSGHAVLAGAHQEDGKEPRLKARSGFVEDRASRGINLMPAPLAGIASTFFDGMKAIGLAALRASAALRILNLKHEVEARPVVRELCVELF